MYGFTSHSVLEAAGWAMDGAVGANHPRISLQYRYGWEAGHGHEITADGGEMCLLTQSLGQRQRGGKQPRLGWD